MQRGGSLNRFVALAQREGWHVTVDEQCDRLGFLYSALQFHSLSYFILQYFFMRCCLCGNEELIHLAGSTMRFQALWRQLLLLDAVSALTFTSPCL
jgi:hypothetical protein